MIDKKQTIKNEIEVAKDEIKNLQDRIKTFRSLLKDLDNVSIESGYITHISK